MGECILVPQYHGSIISVQCTINNDSSLKIFPLPFLADVIGSWVNVYSN